MCGIVGIATLAGDRLPSEQLIQDMCRTILHRGPDDQGTFVSGRVGMGMRRLSIIDVSGGKQPIYNETGTVCTVFNGEIYNYRELRVDLQKRGHIFRTETDTEVIVHAYEEYGKEFVSLLNGMFGISIFDQTKQRVILARDHIGVKPLYYFLSRNYLVWGSEIKALLASGLIPREMNVDALGQFMSWEYVPGAQTLFNGIHKLEPASVLEVDLNGGSSGPMSYWDVPLATETSNLSLADWEDRIDAKVAECTRRQMVSDVPLGAFLSGGVDSSLIVAAMGDAKTFSIGFEDPSYNELRFSKEVADHLGVEHVTEEIEPDVGALFDHLMYFMDDPIGDFSIFPTYLVSKLARKHVTVALSGDGGDELFGGYDTYAANALAAKYQKIPAFLRKHVVELIANRIKPTRSKKGLVNKVKRFVEGASLPIGLGHARWRLFVDTENRHRLFTKDALAGMHSSVEQHIESLFDASKSSSALNRSLYVDVKSYLSDNILTKVDRMSMAASLESRVPFLDHELVALAFSVPDHLKVSSSATKVLLKKVALRHIPRHCIYRPKEGFSIPIKNWLQAELRPLLEESLDPKLLRESGVFEPTFVENLKREHLSGIANHSHILWSLMVFQAWHKKWFCTTG